MIHWLLQSLDDCPDILRSDGSPAWLSAPEQERLHAFKVEKRRRDWLLGRWTAKNLVQRYLAETMGETPALETIVINADADGAPYAARIEAQERLPVSLSISHSHGTAFCGLVETSLTQRRRGAEEMADRERGGERNLQSPISNLSISQSRLRSLLGCDIEFIEPREPNFVSSYFAAEEMAAVAAAGDRQDVLITAIWSAKEAVLKAMREGLRIDTRRIACHFDEFLTLPQVWTPFTVIVDEGIVDQFPGAWSGWWRAEDRFVLTMALLA